MYANNDVSAVNECEIKIIDTLVILIFDAFPYQTLKLRLGVVLFEKLRQRSRGVILELRD